MNRSIKQTVVGVVSALAVGLAFAEEWDSNLQVGLNLTDGNSETLTLNTGLTAERGDDDENTKLGVEYNYGETQSKTTVQNIQAYAKEKRVFSGDTYGYADANYLHDDIADIKYRFIVGIGIGQYLLRNDATTLGVEFGLAWISEDVGKTDNIFGLRFGQNFEHKISDNARIFESIEFLPEANDWDNYLINFEAGVEAAINSDLSLRVVIEDRYDNTPAGGRDENDIALVAGLSYAL